MGNYDPIVALTITCRSSPSDNLWLQHTSFLKADIRTKSVHLHPVIFNRESTDLSWLVQPHVNTEHVKNAEYMNTMIMHNTRYAKHKKYNKHAEYTEHNEIRRT